MYVWARPERTNMTECTSLIPRSSECQNRDLLFSTFDWKMEKKKKSGTVDELDILGYKI